ncbi:MAG TPA: hypothetical protein P5136_00685 [Methanofastidiosum sp.]|nr:hypothetical protein [Methanofastidiosum sp.]
MEATSFFGLIICIYAIICYLLIGTRNDWVLDAKLAIFEKAIRKRKRLELYGKEGLLLKDIENGMWSYNKMLFTFWENDPSKMFWNKYIQRYVYDDNYTLDQDDERKEVRN